MRDREKSDQEFRHSPYRPLRLRLSLLAAIALIAAACSATAEPPPPIQSASSPTVRPLSPVPETPTAMLLPTLDRTAITLNPNRTPVMLIAEKTATSRALTPDISATARARAQATVAAITTATARANNK